MEKLRKEKINEIIVILTANLRNLSFYVRPKKWRIDNRKTSIQNSAITKKPLEKIISLTFLETLSWALESWTFAWFWHCRIDSSSTIWSSRTRIYERVFDWAILWIDWNWQRTILLSLQGRIHQKIKINWYSLLFFSFLKITWYNKTILTQFFHIYLEIIRTHKIILNKITWTIWIFPIKLKFFIWSNFADRLCLRRSCKNKKII